MDIDQQNVINILGIENLPDKRKLEILGKITELVEKRLMVRLLQNLPKDKQNEFAEILKKNQAKQTQTFISANFPDFQNWLVEEINAVKSELASLS